MSEKIVRTRDLAFITNVVGVELFSFTIYAAFDRAFQGGIFNGFVLFSMISSALLIIVTYSLLGVRELSLSEKVKTLVATLSEVLVAFLPAGMSNIANGYLEIGTVFIVLSVVGIIFFVKYVTVFKRLFFVESDDG